MNDADLQLAIAAAREAGATVLRYFGQDQAVRFKSPSQPVTEADLAADRILREKLLAERPVYGWLSEETQDSLERLSRSHVWVVDPIDGTRSFVAGHPEWGISIGLAIDGEAVLGVIYNAATDELFHAVRGRGAWRNSEPIHTRGAHRERPTLLASRSEIGRGELEPFRSSYEVVPLGSTAYKMMRVAAGEADVFLSRGPKSEWDLCAAVVIVNEAGGRVTDSEGQTLNFNRPDPAVRGTIAASAAAYEELWDHLAQLETAPEITEEASE